MHVTVHNVAKNGRSSQGVFHWSLFVGVGRFTHTSNGWHTYEVQKMARFVVYDGCMLLCFMTVMA